MLEFRSTTFARTTLKRFASSSQHGVRGWQPQRSRWLGIWADGRTDGWVGGWLSWLLAKTFLGGEGGRLIISQVAKRPFDAVADEARRKDEHAFQVAKRAKHRLESVHDGHIVDAGEDERLAAAKLEKTKEANDRERKNKAAKIALALKPKPALHLSGKTVFFECGLKDVAECYARRLGMATASTRAASQVIVVPALDITELAQGRVVLAGMRGVWSAVLRGGIVLQPEMLASQGAKGAAIVYKPAIHTSRRVFMSTKFATCHAAFAELVKEASKATGSKWTFDSDFGKFKAGAKNGLKRIAIVTEAQKRKDSVFCIDPTEYTAPSPPRGWF